MQEQAGSILSRFRPAVGVASVRPACERSDAPAPTQHMVNGRDSAREWMICALNRSTPAIPAHTHTRRYVHDCAEIEHTPDES